MTEDVDLSGYEPRWTEDEMRLAIPDLTQDPVCLEAKMLGRMLEQALDDYWAVVHELHLDLDERIKGQAVPPSPAV